MSEPTFDADGYPTDDTAKVVAAWPFGKFRELMAYVKRSWRYADHGTDLLAVIVDSVLFAPVMIVITNNHQWLGSFLPVRSA